MEEGDSEAFDLGSPAPFDGVIKSDHHRGRRWHKGFYQQDPPAPHGIATNYGDNRNCTTLN
jgi:hypothetical protein